jgi:hypothetical protein
MKKAMTAASPSKAASATATSDSGIRLFSGAKHTGTSMFRHPLNNYVIFFLMIYSHIYLFIYLFGAQQGKVNSYFQDLSFPVSSTTTRLRMSNKTGFAFPPMIFGHVHMVKTAGTEINGVFAHVVTKGTASMPPSSTNVRKSLRIRFRNMTE